MRRYLRHSTSIPITIAAEKEISEDTNLCNLSSGGLCFITHAQLKVGEHVDLVIPIEPSYACEGVVTWRKGKAANEYEVGVRFVSDDEYFRVRMVEQICQIEEYRKKLAEAGENITSEEAAIEWIKHYAADFDEE